MNQRSEVKAGRRVAVVAAGIATLGAVSVPFLTASNASPTGVHHSIVTRPHRHGASVKRKHDLTPGIPMTCTLVCSGGAGNWRVT